MKLLSLRTVATLTLPVIFAFFAAKSATAEQVSAGDTPSILADDQLQMQEITDAMSRFRDRDVEGALKYLETATKKNPDLPPVYVILARFYQEINLPQGVLQALETAVQKSPDDPEAYVHLAQLALRDRRVTEADLLYNKANAILAQFDKSAKRKETLMPAVVNGL